MYISVTKRTRMKEENYKNRYRVNILHRGIERWKYCKSIKRAIILQKIASTSGLDSNICIKTPQGYKTINTEEDKINLQK